jgi:hypothetical protein
MWEESWPNLIMKMKDMPYYHYRSDDRKKKERYQDAVPGDVDILKSKFSKYLG